MIEIIYETKDFLVLNKPAGILVHKSPHTKEGLKTLVDFLIEKNPEIKGVGDRPDVGPGIVHRLDKYTSGVLVVAKSQEFFDYFKALLKNREVKKTYLALICGRIEAKGTVETSIGLIPGTTRRTTARPKLKLKMIKEAVTEYRPLKHLKKEGEEFTFIELYPKTGRTHQLRVHMASIHHPIAGDGMYGKRENPFGLVRLFLHAKSIEFSWQGKGFQFEASLPSDLSITL